MKNQRVKGAAKIFCNRGGGRLISDTDCVPNVTPPVCSICKDIQEGNISASADTITPEEEAAHKYDGTYRSSAAVAVDDGYIDK
jgi:hypothetical protein